MGVAWVSNLLLVSVGMRSNAAILLDVQFELDSDYWLNGQDIQGRVEDGIVTLSGKVNTFYTKTRAADVVSRIPGIRDVANTITVKWIPMYSDAALKARITRHLEANWETRWVAGHITVSVVDEVATLRDRQEITWTYSLGLYQ